ncbi:hypothetical protein EW146_g6979, partial [Bondarzewia mesenterica]
MSHSRRARYAQANRRYSASDDEGRHSTRSSSTLSPPRPAFAIGSSSRHRGSWSSSSVSVSHDPSIDPPSTSESERETPSPP